MKRTSVAVVLAAAAAIGLGAALPAAGQGRLLEEYVAFLGDDDHYNSRGVRLTEPWQIIRQDRANFHRFGIRDRGDESDRFFASADNRARMERMILNGYIERRAGRRIVNERVWIRVKVYRDSVDVTVE